MAAVCRTADRHDASALAGLRWAWRQERHPDESHDWPAFEATFARWMESTRITHQALIAFEGEEVVGMGWIAMLDRLPNPGDSERHHADLQSLYVLPGRRNQGIGSMLVERLVAIARREGCDKVTVYSGRRSSTLYPRHGFAPFERLMQVEL